MKKNLIGMSIIVLCASLLVIVYLQVKKPEHGKYYYFIEEVGVLDDVAGNVYEPKMIQASIENELGVTAELKEMVCQNGVLSGYIDIIDKTGNFTEKDMRNIDKLTEKYQCNIIYGGKDIGDLGSTGSSSACSKKMIAFKPRIEKTLDLPINESPIEINITGFDRTLIFQLEKAKGYASLSKIGPTVEKNGTSITTITEKTENGIDIAYCILPSDEVVFGDQDQRRSFVFSPYHYDESNVFWATSSDGKRMPQKIWKTTGKKLTTLNFINETKELPTELHFGPMSGMAEENQSIELPIPSINETLKVDIPVRFSVGDMRFVEVSRSLSNKGEVLEAKIEFGNKNAYREIYLVDCEPLLEKDKENLIYTGTGGESPEKYGDPLVVSLVFSELQGDTISINCRNPIYWINETYDVPLKY